MIIWSQEAEKIRGETNSTFIALIPKERNPSTISRYMPISLRNSSYKILSKFIANGIKKVISLLISKNQGGFIARNLIYDNIVIVQEAIHSSLNRREEGMAIKLDLANAFDRIRYAFIF